MTLMDDCLLTNFTSPKVIEPVVTIQTLEDDVSLEGPMNQYLKDNNIEMAAQRATAVLSVVNHAQQKELRLRDKIMVRLGFLNRVYDSK